MAIKVFFMFKRNVSNIYWTTKLNLYKSMIVQALVYGSPCYGLGKNLMAMIENVQKRIVKWISQNGGSYKACLDILGFLPLPVYIQVNKVLLLSKLILGRYDNELVSMITNLSTQIPCASICFCCRDQERESWKKNSSIRHAD